MGVAKKTQDGCGLVVSIMDSLYSIKSYSSIDNLDIVKSNNG